LIQTCQPGCTSSERSTSSFAYASMRGSTGGIVLLQADSMT
jgi:hypothetical protein